MIRIGLLTLLGLLAVSLTAQAPVPPSGFNEAMLRGKEFLLEKQNFLRGSFPQDYALGRLQGFRYDNLEEGQAVAVMNQFLTAILEGRVPTDKIGEQWRPLLSKVLTDGYALKLPVKSYRLGRLKWDDGTTIVSAVSLQTDKGGVARGQIYVEKSAKGQWEVSDFQLDFTELSKPMPKRTDPFSPGTYENLLGI